MNYTKAELRGRTGTSRLTKAGKGIKTPKKLHRSMWVGEQEAVPQARM